TVDCTATDSHENTATASFDVTVEDTDAPVVTVPDDFTVEADESGGANVTYSASAVDAVDGPVPVTCNPPSGSFFPIQVNVVTCRATDTYGNTGWATFRIRVKDATPPTLKVPDGITVAAGGPTVVNFDVTSTDVADPSPSVTCDPPSGSTFVLGLTTVTCTAT